MKYDLTIATEKMHNEAFERGLRIIGKGKNCDYRLYRFIECGHEQEFAVYAVRRGKCMCSDCQMQKIEQEAVAQGLTVIGKGKNTDYRLYRCLECGTEREFQVGAVRSGRCMCSKCQMQKIEQEAEEQGLGVAGKGKSASYRLYRCLECGHEQEFQVGRVRAGSIKCSGCYQQKIEQEAVAQGLTVIGKGKDKDYRLYRCLECGHEQEFATGNVRRGICMCSGCGSSSYGFDPTKAGSCYLYRWEHPETKHSFLKFGITNRKVETRINEQAAKTAYKPSQIVNMAYPSGQVAKELERDLEALQAATGGPYMKKQDFERGFTETVSMEHEQAVKDLISEYCFGLIGVL